MKKRIDKILILVFLAALIPRVLAAVYAPHQPWQHWDVAHDVVIARNLAAGHGFANEPGHPTAYRYPLLPLILSVFFRVFGERYIPFMLLQALLGALTAAMTAQTGKKVFGKPLALSAGLFTALNPELISFTRMMLTETLFAFFLALAGLLLTGFLEKRSFLFAALSGAVLGAASLCRPVALVWEAVFGLFFIVRGENSFSSRVKLLLTMALFTILPLSPWLYRNAAVSGKPVLATSGGITFWLYGHNDAERADENTVRPLEFMKINEELNPRNYFTTGEGDPADMVPVFNMEPSYQAFSFEQRVVDRMEGLNEFEADRELNLMAMEYIRGNPLPSLKFAFENIMKTFAYTEMSGRMNIVLCMLMPFFFLGVHTLSVNRSVSWTVFSCLISMLAVHFIFYFDHRFRVPYEPFLALLGTAGIYRFWQGNLSVREKISLIAGVFVPAAVNYFLVWGNPSG